MLFIDRAIENFPSFKLYCENLTFGIPRYCTYVETTSRAEYLCKRRLALFILMRITQPKSLLGHITYCVAYYLIFDSTILSDSGEM